MYQAGFWYRYTGMSAKILTPKKADLLFFTLIFSMTHLCFFTYESKFCPLQAMQKKVLEILSTRKLPTCNLEPLRTLVSFGVGNGMPKDSLDTSLDITRKKALINILQNFENQQFKQGAMGYSRKKYRGLKAWNFQFY